MKKLNDFLDTKYDTNIIDIKTSSKNIKPGDLFVCIKGVKEDRHKYIKDAIEKGAAAIVVSKRIKEEQVPIIKVKNTNKALIDICKNFYDNPEEKVEIIAITGTDGKTTTAFILSKLLNAGYIGTLGAFYKNINITTENTTPSIEERYKILNEFIKRGCKKVVMEVSSEAIYRKRMSDTQFSSSILTNITEDHLNIHKTLENYVNCKAQVFINTQKEGYCILNKDDQNEKTIEKISNGKVYTYGFHKEASLHIDSYKYDINKSVFTLVYNNKKYKFQSNLIGKYNIYNLTACILYLLLIGYNPRKIRGLLKRKITIPGRFEIFKTYKDSYIILDYAHTTNGLYSVLKLLNSIKINKIITITGSAGGREKEKRKEMGKVVTNLSDYVIFTMDDPRYEKPKKIIKDMLKETKNNNYTIIINRKKAIKKAVEISKKNDFILLAGKGRDDYMIIKDKYIPYNDYDEIKKWTS
ncbi:MAG: UDP-N-acetylmuramoyl-L-alanyl-D-glutamate--2,6-diaminopimelate ligase [Bacilli bacterium]